MIYVIMASYLEFYPTGALNREEKFIRAVDSFIANIYPYKKLIIISDGCKKTVNIYEKKYKENEDIICLTMEKQPLFSGNVRNKGIEYCKTTGLPDDVICYLDSDDSFGSNHLKIIMDNFGDNDFVVYNTHRFSPQGWYISKVAVKSAHIGTSSFAHKLALDASWDDGYGHDWKIIERMANKYRYSEIPMPEYYIHHTPNSEC